MEAQSGNITYLIQFKSPSEKIHTINVSISKGQDPEDFAVAFSKAYKLHFKGYKRVLYRGILLQKPIVSLVKFSKITNMHPSFTDEDRIFIQEEIVDHTLTAALHKPAILRGVDRSSFFEEYRHTVVATDGSLPNYAVLVQFVDDPSALKVVRIVGTAISVGFGIGGAFGLSL
ncbi:hypothetical protein FVEN_g9451 [Fusarium venenatum]|uniref:Uncharacterized protein n=1 Tax=Fusarium venenatum TaxID=56646 RepID=A0A2L2TAV4_9HYPO|nr:uncharacterized protein FVRRES_05893 [Fusarium venenatum]KAG8352558.1 hypothetical protein FVEN_g9451 [Fusarium venenatum]KAH6992928.1 hypothetical protein EDB82DRAFT_574576 [Fusarium venenatum]CEI61457.1 unnamed protein product [Fusarium venenatum]